VAVVTGEERLRELARMMGGVEDSDVAIEHAKELLGQASTSRQSATGAGRLRT
jgi:ATPase involved in DNA repair